MIARLLLMTYSRGCSLGGGPRERGCDKCRRAGEDCEPLELQRSRALPAAKSRSINPRPKLPAPAWAHALYDALRVAGVSQFAYVPDAGHSVLINRSLADANVHSVALTTEEEGVALVAGAHLGGARAVLLMQSSGVGNCINMLSLIRSGRFPFLTFVSMRGDYGEGNPWQIPMGQSTQKVLAACDVICMRVESAAEVLPTAQAALTMAFQSEVAVAVLLSQKLIGAKRF